MMTGLSNDKLGEEKAEWGVGEWEEGLTGTEKGKGEREPKDSGLPGEGPAAESAIESHQKTIKLEEPYQITST